MTQPIEIPLDAFPGETLKARVRSDWEAGAITLYEVHGRYLRGTFRIGFAPANDPRTLSDIQVQFGEVMTGRQTGRHARVAWPDVYGAVLAPASSGVTITTDSIDERTEGYHWGTQFTYPRVAGRRLAAACRTLVRHWLSRSDLPAVRQVAGLHHAAAQLRDLDTELQRLNGQMEELQDVRIALRARRLAALAVLQQQPDVLARHGLTQPPSDLRTAA